MLSGAGGRAHEIIFYWGARTGPPSMGIPQCNFLSIASTRNLTVCSETRGQWATKHRPAHSPDRKVPDVKYRREPDSRHSNRFCRHQYVSHKYRETDRSSPANRFLTTWPEPRTRLPFFIRESSTRSLGTPELLLFLVKGLRRLRSGKLVHELCSSSEVAPQEARSHMFAACCPRLPSPAFTLGHELEIQPSWACVREQ